MTLTELLCSFFLRWEIVYVWVCVFLMIRLFTSASLLSSLLSSWLKYQSEACTRHTSAICDQISFRDLLPGRPLQDFKTFCSNFIFSWTEFSPLNGFSLPFGADTHLWSISCFPCLKTPGSAEVCATVGVKGFSDSMRHLDGTLLSPFQKKLQGFYFHCYTAKIYHNWNKRLRKKPIRTFLSRNHYLNSIWDVSQAQNHILSSGDAFQSQEVKKAG